MKNNKVLLLILATTFSPFLIAAILTTDYFSHKLDQKQYGEFLEVDTYLPLNDESITKNQWQLVISSSHKNHDALFDRLNKIKTALGKRSELVNVLSTNESTSNMFNGKLRDTDNTVYIATPKGQLLLAYKNEQIGKPLYKDLSHILRSNSQ
jgi:hypothetical protein